jgi:hypothetical protein
VDVDPERGDLLGRREQEATVKDAEMARAPTDAEIVAIGAKHGLKPEMARVFYAALDDGYRSGYAAGYEAAREQAAGEVERWSLPTIQTPSMWLVDKAGIAAAIRNMEPDDV